MCRGERVFQTAIWSRYMTSLTCLRFHFIIGPLFYDSVVLVPHDTITMAHYSADQDALEGVFLSLF